MSDTQQTAEAANEPTEGQEQQGEKQQEQTFTQADIDRIVRERVKREREKFADYDDLKAAAGDRKTAEERIANLEKQLHQSNREALRRRVQAAHGIADEDADLFLTGTDEETLTLQAQRLAARESERKTKNNVVPREGDNHRPADSKDAQARAFFGFS